MFAHKDTAKMAREEVKNVPSKADKVGASKVVSNLLRI
jgi:hypothetical protein